MKPTRTRQRGFTLVEAIVVMVITGILAGITVLFIRRPVQNYFESAGRAEMADVAEIALRRMARELHGAVPNSIRWMVVGNTTFVEFIPTKAGGRYLSLDDGATGHLPLDFSGASTQFEVVGPMPTLYPIAALDYIIVYNLGSGFANADAYATNAANRAVVASISNKTITLQANRFANATPSPGNRFAVAGTPVTFACTNNTAGTGTLIRYWNYDFQPNQVDPTTLPSSSTVQLQQARMAGNVLGCQFSVTQAASRHTAMVGLSIALARPRTDATGLETVTLAQQIHVDNTP